MLILSNAACARAGDSPSAQGSISTAAMRKLSFCPKRFWRRAATLSMPAAPVPPQSEPASTTRTSSPAFKAD